MQKNIIFLAGLPGVGKTRIGYLLAYKLNLGFLDLDQFIEQKYNLSVSQIFSTYGESGFRAKESSALNDLKNARNQVIALGAGALTQEQNRSMVFNDQFFSIYLKQPHLSILSKNLVYNVNSNTNEYNKFFAKYKKGYMHSLSTRAIFSDIYQKHKKKLDDYINNQLNDKIISGSGLNSFNKTSSKLNLLDDLLTSSVNIHNAKDKSQFAVKKNKFIDYELDDIVLEVTNKLNSLFRKRKVDYEQCKYIYDISYSSDDVAAQDLFLVIKNL